MRSTWIIFSCLPKCFEIFSYPLPKKIKYYFRGPQKDQNIFVASILFQNIFVAPKNSSNPPLLRKKNYTVSHA